LYQGACRKSILPNDRAWTSLQHHGASLMLARAVIPAELGYTGDAQAEIGLK
jgi:hypothetical protein